MAAASKEKVGRVRAKQAVVVTVGARPPVWQKRIVRDRHTGKLVEIDMNPSSRPSTRATWAASTPSPEARKCQPTMRPCSTRLDASSRSKPELLVTVVQEG